MVKPKIPEDVADEDFKQGLGPPSTLPVDTDDNDRPDADASGDSDDERPGENMAVPEPASDSQAGEEE